VPSPSIPRCSQCSSTTSVFKPLEGVLERRSVGMRARTSVITPL
jgi:hypothetical protein